MVISSLGWAKSDVRSENGGVFKFYNILLPYRWKNYRKFFLTKITCFIYFIPSLTAVNWKSETLLHTVPSMLEPLGNPVLNSSPTFRYVSGVGKFPLLFLLAKGNTLQFSDQFLWIYKSVFIGRTNCWTALKTNKKRFLSLPRFARPTARCCVDEPVVTTSMKHQMLEVGQRRAKVRRSRKQLYSPHPHGLTETDWLTDWLIQWCFTASVIFSFSLCKTLTVVLIVCWVVGSVVLVAFVASPVRVYPYELVIMHSAKHQLDHHSNNEKCGCWPLKSCSLVHT